MESCCWFGPGGFSLLHRDKIWIQVASKRLDFRHLSQALHAQSVLSLDIEPWTLLRLIHDSLHLAIKKARH